MDFTDKVVIITGASSGIGAAAAIQFTQHGASVVMTGRNQDKLRAVKDKCEAVGKTPLVIEAELTDTEELKRIVDTTIEHFGKIDVLVNNAGILRGGNLNQHAIQNTYDELMDTNVRSVVYLTTYATPHLIPSKGNIVNISSTEGERVMWAYYTMFSVSKAALNQFTKAAAMELKPYGVRVNTISPARVRTDLFRNEGLNYDSDDEFVFKTVMNTWTEPKEIADLILYVASDKAKAITGSKFISDNGNTIL